MKNIISYTKGGIPVYVDENTKKHMEAHASVTFDLIAEAISKVNYVEPFYIGSVDMEKTVGVDHCIKTTHLKEEVQLLYRKGRDGKTPVIVTDNVERYAEETSNLTVGICKDDDGKNTLFTAFEGQLAPKEPWDPTLKEEERATSVNFWNTHAIVCTPDTIDWSR